MSSGATQLNAIKARWDANSLDATFAGGIWAYQAPPASGAYVFPYVIVRSIATAAFGFSSSRRADAELLQFSIFTKPGSGVDPIGSLDTLTKALTAVFDNAKLSLDTDVKWLSMRRMNIAVLREDDNVYQCAIDYELRVAEA